MISLQTQLEIRRLFFTESLSVNAIARNLSMHHSTVRGIVESSELATYNSTKRLMLLDSYVPFITSTLETYPKITGSRLFQMIKQRGYQGQVDCLRRRLQYLRPKQHKAFLRLVFLPGEQAQVDWASFGKITIGNATHKLSCFSMTLSYSRYLYLEFTLDQTMESFLRLHVCAFEKIGGVPRKIAYDNLKSVVLERADRAIRFNSEHLKLADYYRFEPVACNVRAGNEKGRVERGFRYIRDNFFCARNFVDLHDVNRQAREWLDTIALPRKWPQDHTRTVIEMWEEEKPRLLELPQNPYLVQHTRPIQSGKTPHVSYETNLYSIPFKLVGKALTLVSDPHTVRIFSELEEIASHVRCYERQKVIENPKHIEGLLAVRPRGRINHGIARLINVSYEGAALVDLLAEQGNAIGGNVSKLLRLLDQYGAEAFSKAVKEAVTRKTPRAKSIEFLLIRNARQAKVMPEIVVSLPNDDRVKNQIIARVDLEQYNQLAPKTSSEKEETLK